MDTYVQEIIIIALVCALIIWLLITKDDNWVPLSQRPQEKKSKKSVINYYAWKGPMFVEDFTNFTCDNPNKEIVPVSRNIIKQQNITKEQQQKCHEVAMNNCNVDTLTAEQDWREEYWNSTYKMTGPSDKGDLCRKPDWSKGDPGNFLQATNNNLDAPNNLTCQARSINKDYCDTRDKVSPYCYKKTYEKCLS